MKFNVIKNYNSMLKEPVNRFSNEHYCDFGTELTCIQNTADSFLYNEHLKAFLFLITGAEVKSCKGSEKYTEYEYFIR